MSTENMNCPCKRQCVRHANCMACVEYHQSLKKLKKTACERMKTLKNTPKNTVPLSEV